MNQEQFDAIMLLFKILGIMATAAFSIKQFFDWLSKKAAEKSLGATKVKELEKRLSDVDGCIEKLTKEQKDDQDTIRRLKDDYDLLKRYIWDLLGKR